MIEITKEMIEATARYFKIDLTDGSQEAAIIGTLTDWANGRGELEAALVNGSPLFSDLVESYYKAKGQTVPDTVKVPLVAVEDEDNVEQIKEDEEDEEEDEKLPEVGETET